LVVLANTAAASCSGREPGGASPAATIGPQAKATWGSASQKRAEVATSARVDARRSPLAGSITKTPLASFDR
jgi:hypothetical protein